jgi:hypothetical protein
MTMEHPSSVRKRSILASSHIHMEDGEGTTKKQPKSIQEDVERMKVNGGSSPNVGNISPYKPYYKSTRQ